MRVIVMMTMTVTVNRVGVIRHLCSALVWDEPIHRTVVHYDFRDLLRYVPVRDYDTHKFKKAKKLRFKVEN